MVDPYLAAMPLAVGGYLVGQAIMWPALRDGSRVQHPPASDGKPVAQPAALAMPLRAMPLTGVIFAFVLAFLASQGPPGSSMPLLLMGLVAAAQAVVQGFIAAQGFGAVAEDPSRYGRFLVRYIVPEGFTVIAFVYGFLQVEGLA